MNDETDTEGELFVPQRRRHDSGLSRLSGGAFRLGPYPRVSAPPAPAVILCSAPPAHNLEEAIANSEFRVPNDSR